MSLISIISIINRSLNEENILEETSLIRTPGDPQNRSY